MAEKFFLDEDIGRDSDNLITKSPKSMYLEFMESTTVKTKELPRIARDNAEYSSTLMMLKKTKQDLEEYGRDFGAMHALLDLPTSIDVKRTVAKMFADPRNAEAISDSEWKRRDAEYQAQKEVFEDKMGEHLRRERELLQQELVSLQSGESPAERKHKF